jgi:NAD(P)H-nitrite reductase large subunit
MCRGVSKGAIVDAIRRGQRAVDGVAQATAAGLGCGSCQAAVGELIASNLPPRSIKANKIEQLKSTQDGLDSLADIERFSASGNWQEMTDDDKQRFKWHGLFIASRRPAIS